VLFDLFVFAHVDAVSDQSVAPDSDVFKERRNDRNSLASNDSNTNATVKYLEQMTERWSARARGSSLLPRCSLDSSCNPPVVTSPGWLINF